MPRAADFSKPGIAIRVFACQSKVDDTVQVAQRYKIYLKQASLAVSQSSKSFRSVPFQYLLYSFGFACRKARVVLSLFGVRVHQRVSHANTLSQYQVFGVLCALPLCEAGRTRGLHKKLIAGARTLPNLGCPDHDSAQVVDYSQALRPVRLESGELASILAPPLIVNQSTYPRALCFGNS